jgi:DNA-binding response OmpR family regulator
MKKILVVEDSKFIASILSKKLSLNYKVTQVSTIKEAKEALSKQFFDYIILDLHLPDGEGIELIFEIDLIKTKVIVLTSSVDLQMREELFRYGILDYFIKDKNLFYSIEEILKVLKRVEENKGERVLLIEDSTIVIKQVEKLLITRNYEVDIAKNGKDGIQKAKTNNYSLIILDLILPDINGKDVLSKLRKIEKLTTVPIIVLSGSVTPHTVRYVLKNGASDFLHKPFIFEEFILKVDIWIDYFKKEKKIEKLAFELQKINENLKEIIEEEVEKSKQKDKLLILQTRHAQMGEAISIIAHQWKQPLNNISLLLTSLRLGLQLDEFEKEEILETIDKINYNIEKLSEIIDEFKDFFKPKDKKVKTTFKTLVAKAIKLLTPMMREKNIKINIIEKDPKEVEVYENEVEQVIINIIKNAIEVFEERNIKDPLITITIEENRLIIEDNAGGIPEEIKDKIFDIYFSTKSIKGTGIGLYMSKIIIEHHCGGKLEVENTSQGAKFIIEC